jgi:SAM-dependent methyltransferase
MCAAYRDDLAFVHHAGFNAVPRAAAGEVVAALKGRRKALVVDLGCGSGELLAETTAAGLRGIGIDQSPAFIKLARKTAPRAAFRVGSVHRAKLPPCDAVTAVGEVLNYVEAGARRGPPLGPLFRRVAAALKPGGIFLFDLIMPTGKPLSGRFWRAGEDWAVLTETVEDKRMRLLTRDITTFRQRGKGWRRADERHLQYLYARDDILRALRDAGFSVRVLKRYGTLDMLPRRLAFRAVKKD